MYAYHLETADFNAFLSRTNKSEKYLRKEVEAYEESRQVRMG